MSNQSGPYDAFFGGFLASISARISGLKKLTDVSICFGTNFGIRRASAIFEKIWPIDGQTKTFVYFSEKARIITILLLDFDKVIHNGIHFLLFDIISNEVENHTKKGCEVNVQLAIGSYVTQQQNSNKNNRISQSNE